MFVSKTSLRHVSRCLQDVFSVTIFRLFIFQDIFKTSSRSFQDVYQDLQRRLEEVFKTSWKTKKLLRWRRFEDVFNTCLEDILKTSWGPTNICWKCSNHWITNQPGNEASKYATRLILLANWNMSYEVWNSTVSMTWCYDWICKQG